MAEDQVGLRKDNLRELPGWTKLFTGFKVALDPKKLLLAAAGILVMSVGWWLLSALFFSFNRTPPTWDPTQYDDKTEGWKEFKRARSRWNLLYEMAGPVPDSLAEAVRLDAADLAGSPEEYEKILKKQAAIEAVIKGKRERKILLKGNDDWTSYWLAVGDPVDFTIPFQIQKKEDLETLKKLMAEGKVTAGDIKIDLKDAAQPKATINGITLLNLQPEGARRLVEELQKTTTLRDIERQATALTAKDAEVARKALALVDSTRFKPSGHLRTLPWFEDRGPNPYLLVTGNARSEGQDGTERYVPWERGQFLGWFASDQLPVLIEPLVKFLRPILYLFDPASGGLVNRIYLLLIILWTLLTWALFGGAITRMAVVQVARPNEKVGMTDALRFASSRYKSFFSAPLFPLIFIVVLTVFLIIFGLIQELTWFFGDIVVAGLFWPIVLLVGLIMAVVLVGLVGWPLMYSTISAEGSDSFDAISRSYSYVYQAAWHYLWYAAVAVVYGAVLVFFVGLMGSLMVYLGKWGVSQTPGPSDREPTYLFIYTPTSFGWRDLMLYKNPAVESEPVVRPSGAVGKELRLSPQFMDSLTWNNRVGAFLVSIWITILFLMVVGFGYSYFWTATTIIYLLMRRKVDDTEIDEVHLEEEEFEEPAPKQTAPAPVEATAPAGAPAKTMVESPAFRAPTTAPPPQNVPASAPAVVATPAPPTPTPPAATPPSGAPKTQLATEPTPEKKDGAAETELPPPDRQGDKGALDAADEKKP